MIPAYVGTVHIAFSFKKPNEISSPSHSLTPPPRVSSSRNISFTEEPPAVWPSTETPRGGIETEVSTPLPPTRAGALVEDVLGGLSTGQQGSLFDFVFWFHQSPPTKPPTPLAALRTPTHLLLATREQKRGAGVVRQDNRRDSPSTRPRRHLFHIEMF